MDGMAEFRHFRAFVEIAARGSFTAGADALRLTQSTISEQIAALEKELGTRLFERGRHGAQLTESGGRLLEPAQRLLRMAADIERQAPMGGDRGRVLRVGATMGPLFVRLPEVVHRLQEEEAGLTVLLRDIPTAEALLQIGLGELDLGILSVLDRSFHTALGTGIESVVLAEEDWVILAPIDHELAGRQAVSLDRIRNEPLILFPRPYALRMVIDEAFARAGISVEPTIETGWLQTAVRCVELGLGISLVPRAVTIAQEAHVAVLDIDEPVIPRRVLIALYRSDSGRSDLTERFLALLRRHPPFGVGELSPGMR